MPALHCTLPALNVCSLNNKNDYVHLNSAQLQDDDDDDDDDDDNGKD